MTYLTISNDGEETEFLETSCQPLGLLGSYFRYKLHGKIVFGPIVGLEYLLAFQPKPCLKPAIIILVCVRN